MLHSPIPFPRVRSLALALALAGATGLLAPSLVPGAFAQSGGGSSGGSGGGSSSGSAGGATGGSVGGAGAAGSPSAGGLGSPAGGTLGTAPAIGNQTGAIPNVPGGPAPAAPQTVAPPATGANTLPNSTNELSNTGSLRPGDTTGGVSGSRSEGTARGGQAPACSEVLAHRDYFTATVIAGCERQAKGGQATGAPDTGRAGNSMEGGVKPLDKPSEVQTKKAPSDAKALGSICSNC
ncbi:hypothetical protein [uncultured Alsobacter sp.]|uniref:hypothetical protein n=1 Tax=uncultured Alsobacter sp. TaxID=1748258 RepID=UPI0025FCC9E1|nr:hypothetical protein [uncultured Alsobacter sp.]